MYKRMWQLAVGEALELLLGAFMDGTVIISKRTGGRVDRTMEHATCSVPGMVALGMMQGAVDASRLWCIFCRQPHLSAIQKPLSPFFASPRVPSKSSPLIEEVAPAFCASNGQLHLYRGCQSLRNLFWFLRFTSLNVNGRKVQISMPLGFTALPVGTSWTMPAS
jgi:hypothetical protein